MKNYPPSQTENSNITKNSSVKMSASRKVKIGKLEKKNSSSKSWTIAHDTNTAFDLTRPQVKTFIEPTESSQK